jgi:hypothetical protein
MVMISTEINFHLTKSKQVNGVLKYESLKLCLHVPPLALVPTPFSPGEYRDSSVAIATVYGIDGRGSVPRLGKTICSTLQRPDYLWGQLSLLSNGYLGLFPQE